MIQFPQLTQFIAAGMQVIKLPVLTHAYPSFQVLYESAIPSAPKPPLHLSNAYDV